MFSTIVIDRIKVVVDTINHSYPNSSMSRRASFDTQKKNVQVLFKLDEVATDFIVALKENLTLTAVVNSFFLDNRGWGDVLILELSEDAFHDYFGQSAFLLLKENAFPAKFKLPFSKDKKDPSKVLLRLKVKKNELMDELKVDKIPQGVNVDRIIEGYALDVPVTLSAKVTLYAGFPEVDDGGMSISVTGNSVTPLWSTFREKRKREESVEAENEPPSTKTKVCKLA